jgi:hypothetical protein
MLFVAISAGRYESDAPEDMSQEQHAVQALRRTALGARSRISIWA